MKKASLFLSAIGATAFTCGGAGLDGPTPIGCVVVLITGFVLFLTGAFLRELDKQNKRDKAAEESRLKRNQDRNFKYWMKCCNLSR